MIKFDKKKLHDIINIYMRLQSFDRNMRSNRGINRRGWSN